VSVFDFFDFFLIFLKRKIDTCQILGVIRGIISDTW